MMRTTVLFALLSTASLSVHAGQVLVDADKHRQGMIHYDTGREHFTHERWTRAEEAFRTAVKLDPLIAAAYYDLGRTYMQMKRYGDAVQAFVACRETSQKIFGLELNATVTARQQLEENEKGLTATLAQSTRPNPRKVAIAREQLSQVQGKKREIDAFGDVLGTSYVVPPDISFALGSAYFRSGSIADAEREYRAAIAVRPEFGQAHSNLAVLLMTTNRRPEAIEHVKLAEAAGFQVNPELKKELGIAR